MCSLTAKTRLVEPQKQITCHGSTVHVWCPNESVTKFGLFGNLLKRKHVNSILLLINFSSCIVGNLKG